MPAAAGRGDRARHAGHDEHRYPRLAARRRLLAATPEDERIATLEPDDGAPAPRMIHEHRVDLGLRVGRVSGTLARVDQLGARASLTEQLGARQAVVHDHVGAAEQVQAPRGDEAGVAGTATHEVHRPRLTLDQEAARAEPRGRWRRVPPGEIEDDLVEARVGADGVVDHHPGIVRCPDPPRHILEGMGPAADQEGNHDEPGQRRTRARSLRLSDRRR